MLLSLSLIGLFLSGLLLYFNARKYPSIIYLGLFFFCISIYSLFQWVFLFSDSVNLIRVFLMLIPFFGLSAYLIGPLIFWYIRSILKDKPGLTRLDMLHFIPAFLFFIPSLAVFLKSGAELTEAAGSILKDVGAMQHFKPSFLSDILSFPVLFLSRPLLVLVYIGISGIALIRYHIHKGMHTVFVNQKFMSRWIPVLLGFLFLLVFSHFLILFDVTLPQTSHLHTINNLQTISAVGLTGLLLSPFFFPTILYGLPRIPTTIPVKPKTSPVSAPRILSASQLTPAFEQDYLQAIEMKADSCMKEQKPYLEPDCNLAYFSKLIHVPAHHLSYFFREVKKQSFNEYRNNWRIRHAKELISEGKGNELTLEAIGFLSGFSSRNAFFHAFKKAEGISPGVFASTLTV